MLEATLFSFLPDPLPCHLIDLKQQVFFSPFPDGSPFLSSAPSKPSSDSPLPTSNRDPKCTLKNEKLGSRSWTNLLLNLEKAEQLPFAQSCESSFLYLLCVCVCDLLFQDNQFKYLLFL